jgi:hypothetical protein
MNQTSPSLEGTEQGWEDKAQRVLASSEPAPTVDLNLRGVAQFSLTKEDNYLYITALRLQSSCFQI